MVSVHERIGPHRDARNTLDARRRGQGDEEEGADCGYHPRRGRHYDNTKDQSLSPAPSGPQVFGWHILNAPFLSWY
jgi:hypothetical protein